MRGLFISCGLCDAGYTYRQQRIEEHKESANGNHVREQHDMEPEDIAQRFRILRKCQSKFDCLAYLFIEELKPTLTNSAIQFAPNYLFRVVLVKIILLFHCLFLLHKYFNTFLHI